MVETIKDNLKGLENEHKIRILYCCESGSRAWGFPSPDSDFDVRFIYARSADDYLNIVDIKDIIDLPVNDVLDIGGWDIKKSLKLFLKSNSPLYEWLQSPIVYQDKLGFANELRKLMTNYYSPRVGANHYLSIAYNTFIEDLNKEHVKIKRYFYALRSILACKWVIKHQMVPPMEFHQLRTLIDEKFINDNIDVLMEKKLVSDEKTLTPVNASLNAWLNDQIAQCKEAVTVLPSISNKPEELNVIFRKYISS